MGFEKQERSKETIDTYMDLADRLLNRHYPDWRFDPVQACLAVGAERINWAARTWRLYRAALCSRMEEFGDGRAEQAIEILRSMDCSPCARKSRKGPAGKQKSLPMSDLWKIREFVERSRGKNDELILIWIVCGIMTGLRPCEWEHAQWDAEQQLLRVRNAKATNGRSHGEYRTLDLFDVGKKHTRLIGIFQESLQILVEESGSFKKAFKKCQKRMTVITKAIWPKRKKRPGLSSARHQTTANLKASGASLAEIGAVLGHATDRTATCYYGRRASGNASRGVVHGTNQDIVKVRSVYRAKSENNPRSEPRPS